ncbi:MAG: penicillin-binding transpeptidase domain-containing protein [Sediminibacterium sp.]
MKMGFVRSYQIAIIIWATIAISVFSACSPNNVHVDDSIGQFFDQEKVEGTYGMFLNGAGTFTLYNVKFYRDSAYSPDQTLYPILFIAGLETGVIPNERSSILIDTSATLNLFADTAFIKSDGSFFSTIARSIGKEKLQSILDTLQYGSKKIIGPVDQAGQSSLTITPDEQLGLIKKLYFNQLPFQKRSQEIVKKLLIRESNATFQLAYFLSREKNAEGITSAWIMGWVEENRHPYFFVIHTKRNQGEETQETQLSLLKNILRQQGFLEGKK